MTSPDVRPDAAEGTPTQQAGMSTERGAHDPDAPPTHDGPRDPAPPPVRGSRDPGAPDTSAPDDPDDASRLLPRR